jgi:hypothetical protein
MSKHAAKRIREEIKTQSKRQKTEEQLRNAVNDYVTGEKTIDITLHSLLSQTSILGARLRHKAKKFIAENYDIRARYEVADIDSLLAEVLWRFVEESKDRFEELISYVAVLDYRCELRLTDFKRHFLATKRNIHRYTYPKVEETLDYIDLGTLANGNYTAKTHRSNESDDGKESEEVGGGSKEAQANRRKYLITGYEDDTLENYVLVSAMLEAPSLSEDARRLLIYLYHSPDASLSEIAEECGYTNKQAAGREIQRIARHLNYLIQY